MIKEAIAKLIKKENLTTEMMEQVMEEIMIGEADYNTDLCFVIYG